MGEITVLGIAGVVIYALLAGFAPARRPRPASAEHARGSCRWWPACCCRCGAGVAVPVPAAPQRAGRRLHRRTRAGPGPDPAVRGQWPAVGRAEAAGRLRVWIGAGLLIAGAAGVGSWFFGAPFLTSTYAYWSLRCWSRAAGQCGGFRSRRVSHGGRRDRCSPWCRSAGSKPPAKGPGRDDRTAAGDRAGCADGRRGVAAAARAGVRRHRRPDAAVVRGEPLHLPDGRVRIGSPPIVDGRLAPTLAGYATRCRRRWCSPRS